jgi:hypothetical protein
MTMTVNLGRTRRHAGGDLLGRAAVELESLRAQVAVLHRACLRASDFLDEERASLAREVLGEALRDMRDRGVPLPSESDPKPEVK